MPKKAKPAPKVEKVEKAEKAPKVEKIEKFETTLSRHELTQFRTILMIRKKQLRGDVSKLEAEALKESGSGDLSSLPMHMADQGTDSFEQDMTLGLMETEGEELQEIEDAIERTRDNTFGVCETCHKAIPKPRLKAIPYARLCLACKTKEEGAA